MKTDPELPGNLTRRLVRRLMRLYYPTIEVSHRERIPAAGAVLFVANHPNSLLDPVVIGWAAQRPVHFFAKAPLFEVPVFGACLHALGMVPAYRGADDPAQVRRNLETLRAGADCLARGEAVGIFPEGKTHDLTRVEMIRTGAARLALQAAAAGAQVIIVPLGLNYERKERFRSAVWVCVGQPIDVAVILRERSQEERKALRQLTGLIEQHLKEAVVHLDDPRWEPFLHELELLLPPPAEAAADPIAGLPQRKRIADAMNYFLRADGPRAEAMAAAIEQHRAQLAADGLSVESRIVRLQGAPLFREFCKEALMLLPGFAPGLAGLIHHAAPFALTRLLVRWSRHPGRATVALNRLLWSLPIYTVWYALVWRWLAAWSRPWVAWLWVALMPLAGIVAWHHWRYAAQAVRWWWPELRMLFRPGRLWELRRNHAELRRQLLALAQEYRTGELAAVK